MCPAQGCLPNCQGPVHNESVARGRYLNILFSHFRGLPPSRWCLLFAVIIILPREGTEIFIKMNTANYLYITQYRVYVQNVRARKSHVSSQSRSLCFVARTCVCVLLLSHGRKYCIRTCSAAHCTSWNACTIAVLPAFGVLGRKEGLKRK